MITLESTRDAFAEFVPKKVLKDLSEGGLI